MWISDTIGRGECAFDMADREDREPEIIRKIWEYGGEREVDDRLYRQWKLVCTSAVDIVVEF